MSGPVLGVVVDGFGQPVRDALRSVASLGLCEVELPAVAGEIDPPNLSRSGRRELLHYVSGLGLRLAALGGDLGGARFNDPASLEQRLDKTRRIIELATDLRVPIVTTHLGRVDEQALQRGCTHQAVEQLAQIADRTGTSVAFETGSGDPGTLGDLLRQVDCPCLGACYDPASLLIDGYDPFGGAGPLADHILLARARDAIAGSSDRPGREMPVGHGQIDFAAYLAALEEAGYHGPSFIRRTGGDRPIEEIAEAKRYIESLLGRSR